LIGNFPAMGEHRRLLMVGVDHQALETLDGDGLDVSVREGTPRISACPAVHTLLSSVDDISPSIVEGQVTSAYLPLVHGTLLDHPSVEALRSLPDVVSARILCQRDCAPPFRATGAWASSPCTPPAILPRASTRSRNGFSSRLRVLPLTPTMRELRASTSEPTDRSHTDRVPGGQRRRGGRRRRLCVYRGSRRQLSFYS